MRIFSLARIAVVASGVCLALAGLAAGPARAGSPAAMPGSLTRAAPAAGSAATHYGIRGGLTGVGTASASNAWAVGYAVSRVSPKVLLLHWNGRTWSRVARPGVLTGRGQLNAITVVSADDAWAAGYTGTSTSQRTLLLHWNGTAWSQVTRPAPIAGALNAVTATAASGWAVGDVHPGGASYSPLILRLTGKAWSRAATRYGTHAGDDVILDGVAVTTGSSAWAIGNTQATSALARWNGSSWRSAYSLFPLPAIYLFNGIAAGPGRAGFVVGSRFSGVSQVPFSARLAGTVWRKVPVLASAGATLNAVTFARGGTAWAAGAAGTHALILRWTGKAWTRISSPGPGSAINGLGFSAADYGWAVGTSGSHSLVLHWNGRSWK